MLVVEYIFVFLQRKKDAAWLFLLLFVTTLLQYLKYFRKSKSIACFQIEYLFK